MLFFVLLCWFLGGAAWADPSAKDRQEAAERERISRRDVRATLRSRSIATRASPSAMRSGRTAPASALTYSMAPPSGYVKLEL